MASIHAARLPSLMPSIMPMSVCRFGPMPTRDRMLRLRLLRLCAPKYHR